MIFSSLTILGCNKPDPQPELHDPIYQDFLAEKALAEKNLAEAQKKLEEQKAEMKKVKPQTGQIKYVEKRYWDAQKSIDLYEQQLKYWTIRLQERKAFARKQYLKAFRAGETWPNPKEHKEYTAQNRLRQAKMQWDSRRRIEEYKRQNPVASASSGNGAPPERAAPSSAH